MSKESIEPIEIWSERLLLKILKCGSGEPQTNANIVGKSDVQTKIEHNK